MKTVLFTCLALSCAVAFSSAADPKDSSKKKSAAQKVSARDLIEKHDTNNDKKLEKIELHNALRTLKYNQFSSKTDTWKQFDTDKDEKLEAKELDALLDANSAALAKQEEEAAKAAADPKAKEKSKSGGFKLRPTDP
ncbi:hypothetical protein AYO49_01860 [Verrucomicrobiaceae bacterium SCGC AG-212-N21]|nr:hypothetical protein AYO49_01860 [Verrucomicrobiaceae bacterium SCGC AG-212-N21]